MLRRPVFLLLLALVTGAHAEPEPRIAWSTRNLTVDDCVPAACAPTIANATAGMTGTTLASDADAFWRGVVAHYGSW